VARYRGTYSAKLKQPSGQCRSTAVVPAVYKTVIRHFSHKTLRHQDTSGLHETLRHRSVSRHFWHQKRGTKHFSTRQRVNSAPDQGKVATLRTEDNSDETRLHRWFGINLVPKCLTGLVPPDTSAPILWCRNVLWPKCPVSGTRHGHYHHCSASIFALFK